MKCDMPGCENDVAETITTKSIHMGFAGECSLSVCALHGPGEIADELKSRGERLAFSSQLVNPFFKCKSLNKSCS